MALHLTKLCVGADSIQDLEDWIERRRRPHAGSPDGNRHIHVTRMMPKRVEELLDGGSLYWVIRGQMAARQTLTGIESFRDADGIGRCRLVLDLAVVPVHPRPMRPFQGWRYLPAHEAPPDLGGEGSGIVDMPDHLRAELRSLGLL